MRLVTGLRFAFHTLLRQVMEQQDYDTFIAHQTSLLFDAVDTGKSRSHGVALLFCIKKPSRGGLTTFSNEVGSQK
eukprot:SAG31_NODE_1618_length_7732_cov_28.468361_4_plen_75_part_00